MRPIPPISIHRPSRHRASGRSAERGASGAGLALAAALVAALVVACGSRPLPSLTASDPSAASAPIATGTGGPSLAGRLVVQDGGISSATTPGP